MKRLILLLTLTGLLPGVAFSDQDNSPKEHSKGDGLRIIALAPHLVEIVFMLGAGEQIIATSDFADYPEAAKKIPRVGNFSALQIEKIIRLKPDRVLAWRTGNPPRDLKRLEQAGLRITYSSPLQLSDVAKDILLIGKAINKVALAEQKQKEYLQRLQAIRNAYQGKARLSLFYEIWRKPLTTTSAGTWPHNVMSECGIDNIFADVNMDFPQVSIEKVLTLAPKVIVTATVADNNDGNNDFWQKFKPIPAVRHQQIFSIDADRLHRMTPRALDALEVVCQQIDRARIFYDLKGNT